jgi:O-acetylhomoserine (thiol)-lyase
MSPYNAYLHLLGVETLSLRMERHCENAMELAEFFESHAAVEKVSYPGLKSNPHHKKAVQYFGGRGGGLMSIELASKEKALAFVNALKVGRPVANLGDTHTLVIHPASTIYNAATETERKHSRVTDGLVRISVGIEGISDLVADFETALDTACA